MSVSSAPEAVQTLLVAVSTPVDLVADVTVFLGPPRSSAAHPAKSVWVESAGGENSRLCGVAKDYQKAQVRVRVRATRDDLAGGAALARACWSALHCQAPTGWSGTHCDASEPRHMGLTGDLHQWEILVTLARVA